MIIDHSREKLLNAIIYFCKQTSACYITKLFKLLYFLDFEHYKQTGRSVTGLDYYALPMGPVPLELYEEIGEPKEDFAEKIDIELVPLKDQRKKFVIEPKTEFDPSYFTKRELRLLKEIADRYALDTGDELAKLTHNEFLPWHQVYEVEGRRREKIPYDYILTDQEKEIIQPLAIEHQEMLKNYQ